MDAKEVHPTSQVCLARVGAWVRRDNAAFAYLVRLSVGGCTLSALIGSCLAVLCCFQVGKRALLPALLLLVQAVLWLCNVLVLIIFVSGGVSERLTSKQDDRKEYQEDSGRILCASRARGYL